MQLFRQQRMWQSRDLRPSYDVVVIGAGVHGLACAYYLAKEHGIRNVAVLERSYLGSGNSGRNTAILRANYRTPEGIPFYDASLRLYEEMSQELEWNMLLNQCGHLTLAHTDTSVSGLRARAEMNQLLGVESRIIGPEEIGRLVPAMDLSRDARYPVLAALYHPAGGTIRHDAVVWGYARACDRLGVEIHTHTEAKAIKVGGSTASERVAEWASRTRGQGSGLGGQGNGHGTRHPKPDTPSPRPALSNSPARLLANSPRAFAAGPGRVTGVVTNRGEIAAGAVVNCTAGWATTVCDMVGVALPIASQPLQACVTEPLKPFLNKVIVSATLHVYVNQTDRGELVIGAEIDPYQSYSMAATLPTLETMARHTLDLFPQLHGVRVLRQWTGICDMTPDFAPIIGGVEGLEGFYLDVGWGTYGFKAGPIAGKCLAELIATGDVPKLIAPFRLARFDEDRLVGEKAAAAVSH